MRLRTKFLLITGINVVAWLANLSYQELATASSGQVDLVWLVALAFVLVWTFASWHIFSGIDRSVKCVLLIADDIRAGKLNVKREMRRSDELGQISEMLSDVTDRIYQIVATVRNGTTSFSITAGSLLTDNKALSERTMTQSALLEETAASTEELSSTVRINSDNTEQANRLMMSATDTAVRGGHVVSEVEMTMSAICDSSKRIADIIGVIDGISFQTNILALNAAVEAARAGDSGRGFAVVASEVRVLAQRVAMASKEIQALINDSVNKVEAGTKLVSTAKEAMHGIVRSVNDVAHVMRAMTDAGREQTTGIESMNGAVLQLDQMTQVNGELVREIAQTANNLHQQSANLNRVLAHFDLGAEEFGNGADAEELVGKAILYAEQTSTENLIAEVNNLVDRRFSDRDLYLVLISLNGNIVAHGANVRLLNQDARNMRDPDGKAFAIDMIQLAKRGPGSGWIDHKFIHPVTQEMKSKSVYVRRHGDVLISCGYYQSDKALHS